MVQGVCTLRLDLDALPFDSVRSCCVTSLVSRPCPLVLPEGTGDTEAAAPLLARQSSNASRQDHSGEGSWQQHLAPRTRVLLGLATAVAAGAIGGAVGWAQATAAASCCGGCYCLCTLAAPILPLLMFFSLCLQASSWHPCWRLPKTSEGPNLCPPWRWGCWWCRPPSPHC